MNSGCRGGEKRKSALKVIDLTLKGGGHAAAHARELLDLGFAGKLYEFGHAGNEDAFFRARSVVARRGGLKEFCEISARPEALFKFFGLARRARKNNGL